MRTAALSGRTDRRLLPTGAWLDAVLLVALVATVVCASRAYVSQERWFYYWDQAVHQDIAWNTAQAFGESWRAGLNSVARSFNDDYNALFAIPLIPFVRGLGDSRLAFVTALSIVCLCPLALSLGVLATRVVSGPRRPVFWTGVGTALLVPITWVPTLRGFPDALPASLVVCALSMVLSERGLRWLWGAALSGVLLAMAAILRRHFAYASLALIETVALCGLVRAIAALPAGKGRWREEARATLLWLVVAGAAAGGTLLTVGHGFMRRVIAIDFSVLYKSYENAITVALLSFLKPYGWANLMAASAGLLLSLRAGVAERGRVVFLTLFAVISGLQWLLAVPQVGEQYTLHFTPIVVMGLLMFGWSLWRRASRAWRPVLAVAACVWLVTNAVLSLSTLKFGKDAVWRPLLAAQWEPLRRYDYNAVLDLVQVLAEHGPPRARVYVAASSHVINSDIVRHADWARVRSTTSRLAVLRAPELDARDEYPVSTLVQADMVATADPLQYHLSPGAQTTVHAVHDIFAQDVAVARDFERLPAVFPFMDGVAVTIFKRVRPTTLDTALETLRIAREYTPRRPGMQPDWVTVGGPFPSWLDRLHRDRVKWVAHPVKRGYAPATALCSLDAPPAVTRLSAQVTFTDRRCPGAALIFSILDAGGRRRPLAEVRARSGEDGRFDLRLETRGAQHLLLELESYDQATSIDYCLLDVRLRTYTAGKPGE